MDWFRKNPFTGGLALLTVLLSLGALYFLSGTHSAFTAETEAYATNTAKLAQLQSARPGPTEENLQATSQELDQAKAILDRLSGVIAAESAPLQASLSPQQFQDALAGRINTLTAEAEAAGVTLPEDFSLGFGRYRTELPAPAAAPYLAQQLETIANVTALVIKARPKQISSIERAPLAGESGAPGETDGGAKGADRLTAISLSPFEISFEADQAGFREALNSIVAAKPVVFLRLLQVANSQPQSPPKQASPEAAAPAAGEGTEVSQIPVVFGRETLMVTMRLASVSARAPAPVN